MTNFNNILIDVDAYKISMSEQYPAGTEYVSSYIEARKSDMGKVTFYGAAHILRNLATQITMDDVEFAKLYWEAQGLPFPYARWKNLVEKHDGYLPLRIQSAPEGMVAEKGNVLMQVINTDPEFYWLTTWVETKLMRVWYPTTVATLSRSIKEDIREALVQTADDPDAEILFKLHDFGARGASSCETAAIGGSAHLLNFMGTDTGPALFFAIQQYGASIEGTAGSIPAAEHSTITSWGRDNEAAAFENMINKFGNGVVAVVSDSYDIYNATSEIWGEQLKDRVVEMEGMLVVRPDSGDPETVPVEVMKRLAEKFGTTVNTKGYKVLNNVRVIQGDGVNQKSIRVILKNVIEAGFSVSNIAFGMGGALLQGPNRDTLGFAMKASAAKINGKWTDVFKDPVTDKGKTSKKGRLALVEENGEYKTIREDELSGWGSYPGVNKLKDVFLNGKVMNIDGWDDIVKRARA